MFQKVLVCLLILCARLWAGSSETTTLVGAGATFPALLYQRWFDEFEKIHPGWRLLYLAVGSGEGIHQVTTGSADFGASDVPLTDDEMSKAKVKIVLFPTMLGAAVPAYNVGDLDRPLNFTGSVLAGIFLGKIRRWNDPAIAAINPGVRLPAAGIVIVHRLDGSGTTYVWTDYLSKVSPVWKNQVGRDIEVKWPVGKAARGNRGVAETIKQTPYSIGYCELAYAQQERLSYGSVRNAAGNFVQASAESITAAADSMPPLSHSFRISITNPPGKDAYPISSFTWLLVPSTLQSEKKAILKEFLRWMLAEGQDFSEPLGYARLPEAAIRMELQAVEQIQ
ncbi:MAG TPA: phosphate ABC transporter substrate-binding protein PstS [Terriglobales bacterium]|nr:phosphate ABC transporter substrate-binding protein PstS [Terriglobales bacterium]